MAASKTLDPSTTTSASEAFQHPLPQVRQFHRSLTSALDDKNERLRILVGGSYRQLLGTAETILQMRKDVAGVEDNLSRVGNGCGRAVVGKMVGGLGRLEREREEGSDRRRREDMSWAARMKVSGMCGVIVAGVLRRGGITDGDGRRGTSLVLAAKVWVLSRLLAKSLSDAPRREEKEMAEEARKKMGKLKSRLIRAIERTLENVSEESASIASEREDLLQTLCAYSLVTNSGAKDTLTHFLRVRGEAMTLSFDDGATKEHGHGILKALQLYTRTLLDVQALAPRRLTEALAGLKTKPLLKDETIRGLEGLRLDVCERWFGDDVLNFTPYVRHDDLAGPQAVETLRGWAKWASEVVLAGFGKTLHKMVEFKTVVELRTKTLELWIKEGGKARGFDPSVVLTGLREVINQRMVQLVESRVGKLHLVGTEMEATLTAWREDITDKYGSLWDTKILEMEINNGATPFKQTILARSQGKNDSVSKAVTGYQTWRHLIDEIAIILEQLKKQRWDDDLEDIEDDLSLESRDDLLSKEDPQMLQDHLNASLSKSFTELHERISSFLITYKDSENIGQISIYILRVLRSIRSTLPSNDSLKTFGLVLVPSLHKTLASMVLLEPTKTLSKPFTKKRIAGRSLWEGNPELPVQPSPGAFKFLHALSWSMANAGGDLWSSSAIGVLKAQLREDMGRRWSEALKQQFDKNGNGELLDELVRVNEGSTNGASELDHKTQDVEGAKTPSTEKTIDPEAQKEILIQILFDIMLFQSSFGVQTLTADDELQRLQATVEAQLNLEASSRKRLETGAKEYWKKTNLLFGMLA